MRALILIFSVSFFTSCFYQSNKKILRIERDNKKRTLLEETEGFDFGEGSFHRIIHFDTLGRQIKVFEIKDSRKTAQTFEYNDAATCKQIYYDLGHANSYADSGFSLTKKDISFIKNLKLNSAGEPIYEFIQWFENDSTYCQEVIYNQLNQQQLVKDVTCK